MDKAMSGYYPYSPYHMALRLEESESISSWLHVMFTVAWMTYSRFLEILLVGFVTFIADRMRELLEDARMYPNVILKCLSKGNMLEKIRKHLVESKLILRRAHWTFKKSSHVMMNPLVMAA